MFLNHHCKLAYQRYKNGFEWVECYSVKIGLLLHDSKTMEENIKCSFHVTFIESLFQVLGWVLGKAGE